MVRITVLGVHFKGSGSLETLTLNKTRAPTRWTPESFRSSGNSTSKSKSHIYLHSSSVCLESKTRWHFGRHVGLADLSRETWMGVSLSGGIICHARPPAPTQVLFEACQRCGTLCLRQPHLGHNTTFRVQVSKNSVLGIWVVVIVGASIWLLSAWTLWVLYSSPQNPPQMI